MPAILVVCFEIYVFALDLSLVLIWRMDMYRWMNDKNTALRIFQTESS